MSLGIATRGVIHPLVGTGGGGGGGGGGASGIAIPFELRDDSGTLQNAVDLSAAGVVKVSLNGVDFADALGDPPTNIGDGGTAPTRAGKYYYVLDVAEVVTNWVWLSIVKAGYQEVSIAWNITDAATAADIASQTTTLSNAITAARDSVNGNVDSLPDAAAIDAALTASHGAGAWSGSDTAAIDAALSATHGPGNWEGAGASSTIAAAVWAAAGEGAHTYGDLVRGLVGVMVGTTTDYRTGTIVAKSLNGAKTRWTWTVDDSGRLSVTAGDLT